MLVELVIFMPEDPSMLPKETPEDTNEGIRGLSMIIVAGRRGCYTSEDHSTATGGNPCGQPHVGTQV